MPEGPEIRQAADQIAAALVDRRVTEMFFAFDRLKPYESAFIGHSVTAVRTRGKGMVICFSNQLYLYSHNQLYGRWYVRKAHSYPQTNRQLRLAIHTAKKSALLYSASDIEVLQESELSTHLFLSRIELDVLDEAVTVEQIEARFRDKRFYRRQLPILLLDQHFLGGLGNYLRSEILFVARVFPTLRPIDCSDSQIQALSQAVLTVTHQSYRTKGITNDLEIAMRLKANGDRRSDYRHYVFNRENRPCFVCGTAIVKEVLAGRRLYYCPHCQAKMPVK
ncbi:endonuclease VIII [Leptolyngbya sp. NIES-2104]|uniref:endonuclease VIII n=1 Tax=Leptolyngbya sp. NIES-2104 TaxID=1552121 RepID=UPI0006EC83AA|nr:endonuclease VIII [Leptolyngbya sp. NIES-2104]GAP95950.1 endonuclease VIII [Leptolyngbya sp. NIES-2104]